MAGMLGALTGGGGASVNIVIQAVDKFSKVFSTAGKEIKGLSGFIQNNAVTIGAAGAALTGFGIAGIATFGSLVKSASTLQEVQNKFDVVFRDNTKEANLFVKELQDGYIMSERASKQYLSAFQDLFVPMGVARDKATQLSGGLVKLAADVGSFNHVATETVINDFQSALVGNHETVKKYGVIITETTLKQKAYEDGIGGLIIEEGKLKGVLTEQEKLQARMAILYGNTTDAQGDTARSVGSYEYATKQLNASFEDLRTSLGVHLIPLFTSIKENVTIVIDWFNNLSEGTKKMAIVAAGFVFVLAILTGVIIILTAVTAAFTLINIWWIAIAIAIIAVIAALVLSAVWLSKNWDKLKDTTAKLGTFIKNVWIGVRNATMSIWNKIVSIIEKSINSILKAINKIISAYKRIASILNLPTIKKLDMLNLTKFKGEMMGYEKYKQSESIAIKEDPSTFVSIKKLLPNIEELKALKQNMTGTQDTLSTPLSNITDDNTGAINNATKSSSLSLSKLESINTAIAKDISDIAMIERARAGVEFNIYGDINGLTGRDLANSLQTELNKKISSI